MIFSSNLNKTLICVLLLSAASATALSDVATLQPSADTTLFEPRPDNNLGAADLATGTTAQNLKSRALIRFNLVGKVPPMATVNSVTLTFKVTKAPPSAEASRFTLHRVLQDWGEGSKSGQLGALATSGEATWETRFSPSSPWSTPGAAAPADFAPNASATQLIAGLGTYTFATTAELAADVQSWIANPASNFGWIMISQSEDVPRTACRLGSKEDPNNAPTLVIDFSAPAQTLPPAVNTQPKNQTVLAGAAVSFGVEATGTGTLTYQWKLNGADIAGASGATLNLNNVQPANAGDYSVVVSNAAGSATSNPATLTVLTSPLFTQQPQSQNANAGASITFSFTASGSAPLSYQWKLNGADIAGASGPTLALNIVQSANAGDYSVVVSNAAGSATSNPATLTVLTAPLFTQQPQSQSAVAGASITFNVTASGSAPLSYQWKLNGFDIAGATNPTLSLTNVQPVDAGGYTVLVRNAAASAISAEATLTVIAVPDIPPSIDGIALNGRTIQIQFTVQPTYQLTLESADDLTLPNWAALTNVSARLTPLRMAVPDVPLGPQRFYRLKVTGRVP